MNKLIVYKSADGTLFRSGLNHLACIVHPADGFDIKHSMVFGELME